MKYCLLNFLNQFISHWVELFSFFIGLLHIAVGSSGSKCLRFSLQSSIQSYPGCWIWIILNPDLQQNLSVASSMISNVNYQARKIAKACSYSCVLQRGVEQPWNGPSNCSHLKIWQRHDLEEQLPLQWQLGVCCEPCIAEKDNWHFCTRTCCPHVSLSSLIIFTVSGFHLGWVLSWFSGDVCMKCGLLLVFVLSVLRVAVCYVLQRERVCPCKSWSLGCCIIYYWIKTIEENLTVHINN